MNKEMNTGKTPSAIGDRRDPQKRETVEHTLFKKHPLLEPIDQILYQSQMKQPFSINQYLIKKTFTGSRKQRKELKYHLSVLNLNVFKPTSDNNTLKF